ncbi:hypothetical protein [Vibrio profundum]
MIIEALEQITAMGFPPALSVIIILLWKQDRRLTILETKSAKEKE